MVLTYLSMTQRRQIILLYGCTLLGVLMGVLSSIVNTRFLAPDEYGDVRYVQNVINDINSAGGIIKSISTEEPSLEDVFIKATSEVNEDDRA